MRYLSQLKIKAYHRNEIPTADDEFIDEGGDGAEDFMDESCKRRFVVATSATPRVYAPRSGHILRIHDCTSITSVVNNGATVAPADYQLEPLNGLTWSGEARPFEQIRLKSGSWFVDDGEATVTVTAAWGWAAIPARIKHAALIVAKEIITNRDEVKLGLVGFSDVGGVVARTNPIVRDAIRDYRRSETFGIG